MATNNSSNQQFSNESDGYTLGGGTTARTLTHTGGDITLTGAGGAGTYTFPSATSTLASLGLNETFTGNKTFNGTITLGAELIGGDQNATGFGRISFTQELDNGSKTASFSVDFGTDQKQKVTLTANTITLTLDTTFDAVGNYLLKIVNGGLATLTWASETGSIKWPAGAAVGNKKLTC